MNAKLIIVIAGLCMTQPAWADEQPVTLKAGAGKEIVENNCASCHSLDYIQMNAPFMGAKVWESEVTKMIKAYGAPIDEADARKIMDYLTANYGG